MSDGPPASLHLTIPSDRRKRKRDRSTDHTPSPETEEKRRRIRQAGAMLFVERGVTGFGMATLARQTRVSPSAMPYLYGKREELLADLVSRHVYELNQAVCAAYDATGMAAPRARLEAMLVAGVKGELAGTCDRLGISCARAWLLLGDR